MILGERMLKAAIVILAIFSVMGTLGFNLSAPLAGLGIGGIAIAFAAQKTLENLFGGVSILGDEVIRIGDTCRFGDRVGTVEDISLRSTRIRTPDRTELSIPNGSLATMNVENLSRRDKLLFTTKLGLRCETSSDQMRYVLVQVRRLLYEHPKVQTEGARSRFVAFDASALTMEIFCYVLTRDDSEFLAIREDLLLRIMDIVNAAGTGFAFPSQTVYLGRDSGIDKQKAESAARRVQKWRDENQLPFPDFAPADISEISNSLPYPQPGSAVGRKPQTLSRTNMPSVLMWWRQSMRSAVHLALFTALITVFVSPAHSAEVAMQSSKVSAAPAAEVTPSWVKDSVAKMERELLAKYGDSTTRRAHPDCSRSPSSGAPKMAMPPRSKISSARNFAGDQATLDTMFNRLRSSARTTGRPHARDQS